jgi:hypothetical protein
MKRYVAALLVVLGVVGVVGVLAVKTGFAEDENAAGAKCSEATLHGMYLLAYDGVQIRGDNKGSFAVAGHAVFDGNGKVDQVFSANFNGTVSQNEELKGGTYTVKANCTGTNTVDTNVDGSLVTHYDLFIAPDGSKVTFVQTDPGVVASGFELRGTAKRVGD